MRLRITYAEETTGRDESGERMDDPHGDAATLKRLGYSQELQRGLGAFSNFALSLSIICILAGGVTSFQMGLCSVGGASIGLGWPLASLFALVVALTMGQVASAFPTAGGLYHWAAILGGRGWGWVTAWFNLLGLLAVLAAINVGAYQFAADALGKPLGFNRNDLSDSAQVAVQTGVVLLITASQALLNVRGIRLTARLTDFSGWWILLLTAALVVALLAWAPSWPVARLWTFENFSGLPDGKGDKPVWPVNPSLTLLFLQGLLLATTPRPTPPRRRRRRRGRGRAASSARWWCPVSSAGCCCAPSCWRRRTCATRPRRARRPSAGS